MEASPCGTKKGKMKRISLGEVYHLILSYTLKSWQKVCKVKILTLSHPKCMERFPAEILCITEMHPGVSEASLRGLQQRCSLPLPSLFRTGLGPHFYP